MSLVSRTNLSVNPSFEVSTAGATGNVSTLARVTTEFVFGVASLRATTTAALTQLGYSLAVSIPAGNRITASTYLKAPSTNTGAFTGALFLFRDEPNLTTFGSVAVPATTEDVWAQFSGSVVVPAGFTCTRIFFVASALANWTIGDVGFFDGGMIEIAGALQPTYFDGDSANTSELIHAWTGTSGLSTSTEAITTRRVLNQGSLTQSAVRAATI